MAVLPGAAPRGTSVRRVGTDARPEAESATSVFVWRGRSIRACVFAAFPLGAGGARPRVEGAPRPPGSVRSGSPPGASANTDPSSGGPRVRVPVSRVLISWKGGPRGCGVRCGSSSLIWNPGASGGWAGPCARPPRAPSGSCALIGTYRAGYTWAKVSWSDVATGSSIE